MNTSITRSRPAILMALGAALALLLTAAWALGGGSNPTQPLTAAAVDGPVNGITVSAVGKVSGTPDSLNLSMGLDTTGDSVSAALASGNTITAKVFEVLKAQGVKEADLQTSGLSIDRNYDDKGNPTGYRVSQQLSAILRDLDKAGEVISKAAEAGGNATRINGVSMDLSDSSALMTAAREKAFAEAKKKAEQYAQLAGRSLGPVQSVSESVDAQVVPMAFDGKRLAAGSMAESVPIEAGSQQVAITVTVVYAFG